MKHKKDTAQTGGQTALFSAEAFHASPIHSQENDSAKRMSAICGQKCLESFAKFNRTGSWAKTFSGLLIGRTDWYSTRCRLIWKLKGTKYKRMYFQLAPRTLRTEGIGFGLLPTPRATKISGTDREDFSQSLPGLMNKGLLPTPRTSDKNSPGIHGNGGQDLRTVIAMNAGMMPTPTTRDYKGARSTEALEAAGRNETNSLSDFFAQTGKTSQLNPRFVLEMMGFPPDWTELPFQNGETNQSRRPETP
jgi:hypothetical protein